jgi:hypothetical protein
MSALSRRVFLLAAPLLLTAQGPVGVPARPPAPQRPSASAVALTHRGFTVDISLAANMPNRAAIEASLKRQIDITADCGARPEIMAFFLRQKIGLKTDPKGGPGFFSPAAGVTIQAAALPPENPILLHELIHALHHFVLPNGNRNANVLRFHNNAMRGGFYAPDDYVMKNTNEYFAVTASLYLWGKVARPPHDRATLCRNQPYYCAWLSELFGVKK